MFRSNILSNRPFQWSNLRFRISNLKFQISVSAIALASSVMTLCLSSTAFAQQQPVAGARYDITNYRIEVQLSPNEHTLRAGADVTFVPLDATRSVVFELNGSLHVDNVEKDGKALTGFVQDAAHRFGAGRTGGSASDRAHSLERSTRVSGGWTVGEQTAGLCWAGRLLFDVRVTLVSIS